MESLQMLWNSY